MITTSQVRLTGIPFLIFVKWIRILDSPGMTLSERVNSMIDLHCILQAEYQDKPATDTTTTEIHACLLEAGTIIEELQSKFENFAAIEGAIDWQNEYWGKVTRVQFLLWSVTKKSKIVDTASAIDYQIPSSIHA